MDKISLIMENFLKKFTKRNVKKCKIVYNNEHDTGGLVQL